MNGNYVVITGAFGGFGQSLTRLLLDKNYFVFALDKNIPERSTKRNLIPIQCDITDETSLNNAVEVVKTITDKLSALINLAGKFDQFPLVEDSMNGFRKIIELNLLAQQAVTMSMFPLIRKGKGRIVNLSSETVLAQLPLQPYGLAKKMFDLWSSQLRIELALIGISVITVRAGGHKTNFIEQSVSSLNQINKDSLYVELHRKTQEKAIKILKRISKSPEEVAKVIVKAVEAKRPRKIYHVNVSFLFRALSLLPPGIRERLIQYSLMKWM